MPDWTSLAEIDLRFARSRRRAARRRPAPTRKRPALRRAVWALALALVLLTVVAESGGVQGSAARPSVGRAAAAPALDPRCPVPQRFRAAFASASARTGVPVSLLVATAYEESRMDPAARSGAGATGLLQLMPATARSLRLAARDPATNVLAGASYLRLMIDRFGSVDLALAAYNAGPTAVAKAGAAPTVGTLRYVENVKDRAKLLAVC